MRIDAGGTVNLPPMAITPKFKMGDRVVDENGRVHVVHDVAEPCYWTDLQVWLKESQIKHHAPTKRERMEIFIRKIYDLKFPEDDLAKQYLAVEASEILALPED